MRAIIKFVIVSAVFTGLLAMHGVSPALAASHCEDHHGAHAVVVEHEHASAADQVVVKEPCPNEHGMHACAGMVRKSGDEPALAVAAVLSHSLQVYETQPTASVHVDHGTVALRKPSLHFLSISRT